MTDKKQIIIDGIQFNEFGDFYVDYDFNGKFQSISSSSKEYKILKSLIEQLARKTQECEQKEKELLSNEKIINKLMKEVDELKQECDTLKSQLDFEVQQKECIEQECEELKEENQKLEMQLCNNCGERDDYNIPCKMIRDLDYGLQKEIEENDRYRKALEEIEEIVKINCEEICGRKFEDCNDFLCPSKNIIDIINKAKGE